MRIRISLRKGEREALLKCLHQAYAQGKVRLIRRIHALLYFFEGKPVAEIAELLSLSEQNPKTGVSQTDRKGATSSRL
jgi:DNA-binding NarL/FixJ family response regulator